MKTAARAALLRAADHIESNPQSFDASMIYIPHELTERGDGLAWVGHFLGIRKPAETTGAVARALGLPSTRAFYDRMHGLMAGWEQSAEHCAGALRVYADAFHPEGRP